MLNRRRFFVGATCTLAVLPALPSLVSASSPVSSDAKIDLIMDRFAGADSSLFFAGSVGRVQATGGMGPGQWGVLFLTLPAHKNEDAVRQREIQFATPSVSEWPTFTVMAWDDAGRSWATYDGCILIGHGVHGDRVPNGDDAVHLTIQYDKRTTTDRPPTKHWVRELQQHHRLVA